MTQSLVCIKDCYFDYHFYQWSMNIIKQTKCKCIKLNMLLSDEFELMLIKLITWIKWPKHNSIACCDQIVQFLIQLHLETWTYANCTIANGSNAAYWLDNLLAFSPFNHWESFREELFKGNRDTTNGTVK